MTAAESTSLPEHQLVPSPELQMPMSPTAAIESRRNSLGGKPTRLRPSHRKHISLGSLTQMVDATHINVFPPTPHRSPEPVLGHQELAALLRQQEAFRQQHETSAIIAALNNSNTQLRPPPSTQQTQIKYPSSPAHKRFMSTGSMNVAPAPIAINGFSVSPEAFMTTTGIQYVTTAADVDPMDQLIDPHPDALNEWIASLQAPIGIANMINQQQAAFSAPDHHHHDMLNLDDVPDSNNSQQQHTSTQWSIPDSHIPSNATNATIPSARSELNQATIRAMMSPTEDTSMITDAPYDMSMFNLFPQTTIPLADSSPESSTTTIVTQSSMPTDFRSDSGIFIPRLTNVGPTQMGHHRSASFGHNIPVMLMKMKHSRTNSVGSAAMAGLRIAPSSSQPTVTLFPSQSRNIHSSASRDSLRSISSAMDLDDEDEDEEDEDEDEEGDHGLYGAHTINGRINHMDGDSKTRPCLWGDCTNVYESVSDLSNHVFDSHIGSGKASYVCMWNDCTRNQKPFSKRHKVQNHVRIHTGHKPFVCHCGRMFSRQDGLATHVKTHSAVKPFVCTFPACGKAYYHIRSLRKHEKNHGIGQDPFVKYET